MGVIKLKQGGWVTRDCPNVIVPTQASTGGMGLGTAWATATWRQLTTGLSYPFLLCGANLSCGLGAVTAVDINAYFVYLMQLDVATGAAGSEVVKASGLDATAIGLYVNGLGGASPQAVLVELGTRYIPLGPIVVPASIRIAVRLTCDGTPTDKVPVGNLTGYNLNTMNFAPNAFLDDMYMLGSRPVLPGPIVSLGSTACTSGASAWTLGAYGQVSAALSYDYLITDFTAISADSSATAQAQFDISLGGAGVEVVQARAPIVVTIPGSNLGAVHMPLPIPFIAYKGERLSVRCGSSATSGRNYTAMVQGVRLS